MTDSPNEIRRSSLGPIIIETAVVTTAVIPFLQEIAKRAADDSYDYLKELFRKHASRSNSTADGTATQSSEQDQAALGILIDDEERNVRLLLDDHLPEQALRELAELDLTSVYNSVIQWAMIGPAGAWTYQVVDKDGKPLPPLSSGGLLIPGRQGYWENGGWKHSLIKPNKIKWFNG